MQCAETLFVLAPIVVLNTVFDLGCGPGSRHSRFLEGWNSEAVGPVVSAKMIVTATVKVSQD